MRPLDRVSYPGAAVPVRIVHLGLGAFHRAHQAWYTQHAGDDWGIAAFTGRSPRAAELLAAQDGLYALVERGADLDRVEVITSISEARDGADLVRLTELLSDPAVGVVTLTITEAGYRLDDRGDLDLLDIQVQNDLHALRVTDAPPPVTPLGRLVLGLRARQAAGSGPIAVVSCDNIPANGALTRRAVMALAEAGDPQLAEWISRQVSFVSTSVDRITPATSGEVDAVIAAGWRDRATVVTEPFADWILEGAFPGGRPAWERAGARFVADLSGWEDRKLWLLNGAHTILVVTGLPRAHATVAEAFADPECRGVVEAFWSEAVTCLPPDVEHIEYRRRLAERFSNPRIAHRLDQIAAESTAKVRFRIAPIARRLRARGEGAPATAAALAAWIAAAPALPGPDREQAAVATATAESDPTTALLRLVGADVDDDFTSRVRTRVDPSAA